ncbi:MAG: hypothetical protein HY286_16535 [Planctomycetes bacterium]|nr:hypothetical protein [Planctomycetota bacterium]
MDPIWLKAPRQFNLWKDLFQGSEDLDPRSSSLNGCEIVVDLEDCAFVRPQAALALLVFFALIRRQNGIGFLRLSNNHGVNVYLKSLGLFSRLKDLGVGVDDRNINSVDDNNILLPLSPLSSELDIETHANNTNDRLKATHPESVSVSGDLLTIFAELASNAIQHAQSEIDAYGFIQYKDFGLGPSIVCVVADGGIGIRAALSKNPKIHYTEIFYDHSSIEFALRERVSGTGDLNRGIGLSTVVEATSKRGRSLVIHSERGMVQFNDGVMKPSERSRLFPGTLVLTSIPA